jgi:mono/diheme cytochrome c family protein
VALHGAGGLTIGEPAFEKGIRFLLRTQFEDGSWYVRSRAWPFQPHFESDFPHGKDQWISAGGTAWAAMALLLTLPEQPGVAAVDWMAIRIPASEAKANQSAASRDESPARPREVDFARDIEPLLARSCAACHGGGKKRGSFSIESRDAVLAGGQSREPAVIPGRSDASRLLRMVTGRIEDLEMPPLAKRGEYPALTADEVALLEAWIDGGVAWK